MPFKRIKPTATFCECGNHCFANTSLWCVTLVDAEDAWLLKQYKWSASSKGLDRYFSAYSRTYGKDTRKSALLHQAVMGHAYPLIDHISRNAHDNRKVNLRPCNGAQSNWNMRKLSSTYIGKKPTSKFKGVSKDERRKDGKLWRAMMNVNDVRYCTYYGFESDASIWYNYHAAHLRGEFAWLNDLTGIEYMHE